MVNSYLIYKCVFHMLCHLMHKLITMKLTLGVSMSLLATRTAHFSLHEYISSLDNIKKMLCVCEVSGIPCWLEYAPDIYLVQFVCLFIYFFFVFFFRSPLKSNVSDFTDYYNIILYMRGQSSDLKVLSCLASIHLFIRSNFSGLFVFTCITA